MRLPSVSKFRPVAQLIAAGLLSYPLFAADVDLKQGKDQVEVVIDGRPFTTYYYGSDTAKAYLMPLRTASGIVISRPFPVGNDASKGDPKASSFEPHQRPLYFAHGDIDGLNFWGEAAFQKYYSDRSNQPYGHMAKASLKEAKKESHSGTIRASFSLEDPNGRSIADEDQEFVFRGDDRTRVIDCEFTLKATHGPIDIGDTKEGTFGIRLGKELSEPLAHMVNSQGGHGEPEIWGKPADWVNYYGTVSGQPVGIVVFDHPTSFRHPTTWHARGYGLLAANPFGLREFTKDAQKDGSWTVVEGGSPKFRYRVLIYDGVMDAAQIGEAYKRYASER
jgi:methane monooxygenase PmoA-like